MPEASIVVKTNDQSSDELKTIAQNAAALGTKLRKLQDDAHALSKEKATLSVDFDKAKKELAAAKKKFSETGDAIDGLTMQAAQANVDNLSYQFRTVSKEAENARKKIDELDTRANKSINSSGGIGSFGKNVVQALAISGITDSAKQLLSQGAYTLAGSALGDEGGMLFSNALSMATSGASAGFMVGGPTGALAGAMIGGIVGLGSGALQASESRDAAFKSYYQGLYDTVNEETANSLTSGSTLAAARETDQISFATLFGGEDKARDYLADLVQMANVTPFLYDDLTSMSKTLATYGYDETSILPVLQTIGDAGAALGMATSDMDAVATAIGRMKSSNKTTLEYLNILNDRGIGAVGMLADAYGVEQGDVYTMISRGEIAGQDAARIILDALTESFAGSMEMQSKTFSGLTSTIEGLQEELDNAMGEGYNEKRIASLTADLNAYEGALGEAMSEVNRVIGENKAMLENLQDQYRREGLSALLLGEETSVYDAADAGTLKRMRAEYVEAQEAYRNGDSEAGLKLESLKEQAEALAVSAYEASEQYQLAQEAERDQLGAIRENTSAIAALTDYYLSQEGSKGMAAGMTGESGVFAVNGINSGYTKHRTVHQRAVGIDYVPYDNFPALLHQGERVQTAVEARSEGNGFAGVQIVMNGVTIREDADIDRVARALLERLEMAGMRG